MATVIPSTSGPHAPARWTLATVASVLAWVALVAAFSPDWLA
jgi:hypothetical protein